MNKWRQQTYTGYCFSFYQSDLVPVVKAAFINMVFEIRFTLLSDVVSLECHNYEKQTRLFIYCLVVSFLMCEYPLNFVSTAITEQAGIYT